MRDFTARVVLPAVTRQDGTPPYHYGYPIVHIVDEGGEVVGRLMGIGSVAIESDSGEGGDFVTVAIEVAAEITVDNGY